MWKKKMILKSYIILVVLSIALIECIEIGRKFRYDYVFSKQVDGWLKLHVIPAKWSDARLRCHAEGAVLASPLTAELGEAIVTMATQEPNPVDKVYTGVHASYSPGVFSSVEGVPLSRLFIKWMRGEPNNLQNAEQCIALYLAQDNGTAADVRCDTALPYVCYKKRTTMVITACGTNDPEYELDARTGNCYKFHRRGLSWQQAYMTCAAEGGHLAIINNEIEAQVMVDLYAKNPDSTIFGRPYYAHLGFRDLEDGGSWMTIDGKTLQEAGYDTWIKNMPSFEINSALRCGTISREAKLNDVTCSFILPFICEKVPDSLEDFDDL